MTSDPNRTTALRTPLPEQGLPPLFSDTARVLRPAPRSLGFANRVRLFLGRWLYGFRRFRPRAEQLLKSAEGTQIHADCLRSLLAARGISIGRYSYGSILNDGVLARGSEVGRYCSVGRDLIVWRHDHPSDQLSTHPFFYNKRMGIVEADDIPAVEDNPLRIGHDVWIGDRVMILARCRSIGNGAIIGAGAVVTGDVPAYAIMVGVPAKPLRLRFDDATIARIEASQWWLLDVADLIDRYHGSHPNGEPGV
jgi:virginiamycin A acetyltransferase